VELNEAKGKVNRAEERLENAEGKPVDVRADLKFQNLWDAVF
jgi:hypothetical protein